MASIQEAKRYVDKAREILRDKARKEDGYYQDTKYVKMAGHTAYVGILLVIDEFLGKKGKGRKDVGWYKEHLGKLDRKLLTTFVSAYDILHLSMSYDGNPNSTVASVGLQEADTIINWVETRTATT